MAGDVELVHDVRAELGEGPVWDDARQRLLFVDILRGEIHEFDPVSRNDRVVRVGQTVGAAACTTDGDWVAAAGHAFVRVHHGTGEVTTLAMVETGRETRLNDGAVDPSGRFWAGTMSLKRQHGQGTLYRLDADGARVTAMLAPVTTSNGIDWSLDATRMYYVDTRTRRVDVFDFDNARGTIAKQRTLVDLNDGEGAGSPDGLIVDAEGFIWVALYGGAGLCRYDPDGRLERRVTLPVTYTTKCAFGGRNLDELYVTSAWRPLTAGERAREPHAGGVFRLMPGVRGKPAHRFGPPAGQ